MHNSEELTYLSESICYSHIIDPVLACLVSAEMTKRECFYCGRMGALEEQPFAVSMNEVVRHAFEAVNWLYHDGYDEFFHEGYPEQYDTTDVVDDVMALAIDPGVADAVVAHIADAIVVPYTWVSSGLHEDFLFSWESFAETVKYQSRFVYVGNLERPGRHNEPPARVSRFLDGLAAYVQDDMLTVVSPGEKLYRARMVDDALGFQRSVHEDPAKHLGPVPGGKASAGRLNPEGVGLFYGATSIDLAVKETALHSLYDNAVWAGLSCGGR